MNILHFKYAVTVAETKSISKAAEKLYMGQPNLSRAIKELESTLGITVFKRTSRGIIITPEGEEFLRYARKITSMVNEVERIYVEGKAYKQQFSVCVPRVSYISHAFAQFADGIERTDTMEICYNETNAMRTIENVMRDECGIGIIRYQSTFDKYFRELFEEKKMNAEVIADIKYVLAMSDKNPFAGKDDVSYDDLSKLTEITHADPYVPSLSQLDVNKAEFLEHVNRRFFVFERGIQFELLESNYDTFMWVSPIPQYILSRHGLVLKKCSENKKNYKDVLIYKKGYKLTQLDISFIESVKKSKHEYVDSVYKEMGII